MDREAKLSDQPPAAGPAQRLFTLYGATRALELVRKIVADLGGEYARVLEYQEILELEQSYEGAADLPAHVREGFRSAVHRVRGYVKELEAVGVELRDFERGLVDFPARMNGRDLRFCWQPEEDSVQFWHEPGQSTCGRRPIRELVAS